MTNAEKFQEIFKKFATEVWAFSEKDFLEWLNAEYKEPTTKNNLGVDCIDKNKAYEIIESWAEAFDSATYFDNEQVKEIIMACANRIDELPSLTLQEPRKGYISIDDVMAVFDDFMCGEVDEDGTNIFLEMLRDKADMREVEK